MDANIKTTLGQSAMTSISNILITGATDFVVSALEKIGAEFRFS
jgi:hypothetical protein